MSIQECKVVTDIAGLIPQRPPIAMVNRFEYIDQRNCRSSLNILPGNMFLDDAGNMVQEGYLEHIAQSAAAYIGYCRLLEGKKVALGYIGDIRKCKFSGNVAKEGGVLSTAVKIVSTVGGITMISATTSDENGEILNCSMKLAVDE